MCAYTCMCCLITTFFFQADDSIRDYKVIGFQTCFFFFQAEDGIRDYKVTGVQTCALPISGDYGIRKGFARAFHTRVLPTPRQVLRRGERWRPYRTVASWYLWRALDPGVFQDGPVP